MSPHSTPCWAVPWREWGIEQTGKCYPRYGQLEEVLWLMGCSSYVSTDSCQAIIWTSAGTLFIGPLGTDFNELLNKIQWFSVKKMNLKMLFAKFWPFCLCLTVLNNCHCSGAWFILMLSTFGLLTMLISYRFDISPVWILNISICCDIHQLLLKVLHKNIGNSHKQHRHVAHRKFKASANK